MKHPGDEKVIEVIRKSRGNITAASRALGVARITMYEWINASDALQAAVHSERESFIDVAETKLQSKILEGDTTSLIFFLKTQGRNRGYVERRENEISGRNGDAIQFIIEADNDNETITDGDLEKHD